MSELTVEILREIAPRDLAAMLPAVVQMGDQTGVILRLLDPATGLVELFQAGRVTTTATTSLGADFVTDHAVQAEQLHGALKLVQETALQKIVEQDRAHEVQLEEIREYAIERHEEGLICRGGLDEFLAAFDFAPYSTRVKVEYTISGSYEVDNSSIDAAEDDAQHYLTPDLSELDNVDTDSSSYDVHISTVTEL
ncbi:hypothetical protein AB0K51_27080 [Kitasatospora sp. NPDC049285]|uniref:hypothetical protein n=1 Tax=Kitasatospora sp. NPDC049285 TaxID=3157096 RepID=UPI003433E3E4